MGIPPASNSEDLIRNDETMRYRPFGKTGWEVSALSFGCMRLKDDEALNTELISTAIDRGINYFETTRFYCNGQCQQRTAPGLKDKREGVIVSGKAGISPNTTAYEFRAEVERQLDILGLTHFKFFQVGWFGWDRIGHLLKRGGVWDAIRQAQDEGLIQRVGFTGHDRPENFTKLIETGLFDSLTVPYSLLNRSYEPTIERAGELGVGVVAMCPVAGGVLAGESDVLKETFGVDMPTAAMALRFVLANPNVSTACSGMNSMAMLEENVQTAQGFDPDADTFASMCEGLEKLQSGLEDGLCTACRYCMPCPQEVDIPRYMKLYRNWRCFGLEDWAKGELQAVPEDKNLTHCTDCGVCEEKCPNDLKIRETLQVLAKGI